MPFCVSSFSGLIKGMGLVPIVPPSLHENLISLAACAAFVLLVWTVRHSIRPGANFLHQPQISMITSLFACSALASATTCSLLCALMV